jgi:carbamoyltransferase
MTLYSTRPILGFSGLSKARQFKESRWQGLDTREYAITQGADAAAALIVGGQVIGAAAEERFDGVKHSAAFPTGAIAFCLEKAGLRATDITCVAHSFSYAPEREFYAGQSGYYHDLYDAALDPAANRAVAEDALGFDLAGRFLPVPHHLAHAASAYVPSGFTDALVLVSDGLGEKYSATVMIGSEQGFETLAEVPAHSSLGLFYGLFTLYLGFAFGDGEYKVMGLAPYGNSARYLDKIMRKWVHLEANGRYFLSVLLENSTDLDKETYRAALSALEAELGPRRVPGAPIEQRHMDIAASLQEILQIVQLHLLGHYRRETGLRRLCMAGGVALNCVANGLILRSRLFDGVYVQAAAGDDGSALGAAFYATHLAGETPEAPVGAALGPSYDADACRHAVEGVPGLDVQVYTDDNRLVRAAADLIAAGNIVGWFQGAMEFGPRALGNRSILADPRRAEMRECINRRVKKRESFRPFAPAVLAERATELFEIEPDDVDRFSEMLFVAHVRRGHADRMPATTHVDGTARLQTVSHRHNPIFWKLIRAFDSRTGLPVVLNTSFNVQGQPIVRTPQQAVRTFIDAGLDALIMDRMIILPTGVRE